MARPFFAKDVPVARKSKKHYWLESNRGKLAVPRNYDRTNNPILDEYNHQQFMRNLAIKEDAIRRAKAFALERHAVPTKIVDKNPWMVFEGNAPMRLEYSKDDYRHPANIAARKVEAIKRLAAKKALAARQALVAKKKAAFYASPKEVAKRKALAQRILRQNKFFTQIVSMYGKKGAKAKMWEHFKKDKSWIHIINDFANWCLLH